MTLSVETVPMIKSQLISNSSERLGSPKAYVAIKYNFSLSKLYHVCYLYSVHFSPMLLFFPHDTIWHKTEVILFLQQGK